MLPGWFRALIYLSRIKKLNFKADLFNFFIWALLGCEIGIFIFSVFARFWQTRALEEKAVHRLYDSNQTFFNKYDIYTPKTSALGTQTPCRHPSDTPLGEIVISEYYDIYSTVLNLYDIYPPQSSARHAQTPSGPCE